MTMSIEFIEREWLKGPVRAIAVSPDYLLEGFSRVTRLLGTQWIERATTTHEGMTKRGIIPTLRLADLGHHLALIEGLPGSQSLLRRFSRNDPSAEAELAGLSLLALPTRPEIELNPPVGGRKADFRVRLEGSPWTYAEVTAPDFSDSHERADKLFYRLMEIVKEIRGHYAVEILLRREPTFAEASEVVQAARAWIRPDAEGREQELPADLGKLFLNHTRPGDVYFRDHVSERTGPRLVMAQSIMEEGALRHVVVRMAFADERADEFLRSEARQLPQGQAGLVFVQMSRVPGGFRRWIPLLKRRLQPKLHTRVSGIVLFAHKFVPTAKGESRLPEVVFIENPYASTCLPPWVSERIKSTAQRFDSALGRR